MSIFQKDCPQCAVPNPIDAVLCACGYCFDPSAVTDTGAAAAVARHEERLYHDYLVARLVQAEAAYEVARADAAADPANTYKAAQVLTAQQALNAARAELRNHKLTRQAPETSPVAFKPPSPPLRRDRGKALHSRRKPSMAGAPQPAQASSASRLAPNTGSEASGKVQPTRSTAIVATPAPVSVSKPTAPSAQPNRAFRARQAKKAATIVSTPAPTTPSADVPPLTPAAPKPMAAATKECPNCTARVAANLTHCRCGFGFNTGSFEMASLPLDAAALAILRR